MSTGEHRDRTRHRLDEELAVLRERRRELADGLGDQDVPGDRADGADALVRSDDLAWVDDRIAELTERARTVDAGESTDGLRPGTRLRVRFDDGAVETLQAVAIVEEVDDSDGVAALTVDSPLGRALTGRREGEIIEYRTPGGAAMVEILDITRPTS